jgi:hypothetical protein
MVSTPAELKTFVSGLSRKVDPARLDKATQMLRADRFQLFVDAKRDEVLGVVKSQGDASLIYSCRLTRSGEFSCCTQNLNVCGGLRGKVCKHILVLMVGLVQSGQMESETVLEWVGNSAKKRPVLDKDQASATFIRYKGAEAGEVDWRPTETMPEDYYAL